MVKRQENPVDIVDKIDRLDKEMSTKNFRMQRGGNQIVDTLKSFPDSLVYFGYYDQAGQNHYEVGYNSKDSILYVLFAAEDSLVKITSYNINGDSISVLYHINGSTIHKREYFGIISIDSIPIFG